MDRINISILICVAASLAGLWTGYPILSPIAICVVLFGNGVEIIWSVRREQARRLARRS